MDGMMWEIKSPTGASRKSTIETQFKGLKQARNLVIDGRRTKLGDDFVLAQIRAEVIKHRTGKVLFVNKSGRVFDISVRK